MARTAISKTAFTPVISTSTTDVLLALEGGHARLMTASIAGVERLDAAPMSPLEKIVVPAGVDAWLWADDDNVVCVDIVFGT